MHLAIMAFELTLHKGGGAISSDHGRITTSILHVNSAWMTFQTLYRSKACDHYYYYSNIFCATAYIIISLCEILLIALSHT